MKIKAFVIFSLMVLVLACSKDDESNPVVTEPAYVGVFEGTNSNGKATSFTISNLNGKAYVTNLSVSFTYTSGSSTTTATVTQSNSQGIVEVSGSSFTISMSSDTNDKIVGAFTSSTNLTGTFSLDTGLTTGGVKIYGTGSFSLTKK